MRILIKAKLLILIFLVLITAASSKAFAQGSNGLRYLDSTIKFDASRACGASDSASFIKNNFELIHFPGNQNFRNHFFRTIYFANDLFGLGDDRPDVLFYDDWKSPNAYAIKGGANENNVVIFGATTIAKLSYSYPGTNNLNTAAINGLIGHEFGHIAQYKFGYNGNVKNMELMADAISGLLIYAERDFTEAQELGLFLAQEAAYNSGDFAYTSPTHHGTPNERLAAFKYGYNVAKNYMNNDVVRIGAFMRDSAKKFGVPNINR